MRRRKLVQVNGRKATRVKVEVAEKCTYNIELLRRFLRIRMQMVTTKATKPEADVSTTKLF